MIENTRQPIEDVAQGRCLAEARLLRPSASCTSRGAAPSLVRRNRSPNNCSRNALPIRIPDEGSFQRRRFEGNSAATPRYPSI